MISIVIPVKDGGQDLVQCLDAIARQKADDEFEVVIVDSGSRDDSVAVARSHGADVTEIDPSEFNHGATRNLAASRAKGEILVFISQDAEPVGDDWLQLLTAPLRDDEGLAGVYGRQLARDDAVPPERFFLDFLYGPWPRTQSVNGRGELDLRTTLFSNVNSAIRHEAWSDFRFPDDIIMSEDQEWSRRVLLDGWKLVYEPAAAVRHSHPYTVRSAFKRFFDSGVSAERAYLAGGAPSRKVVLRRAADYGRGELRWLWRNGHRRWIPYAIVYELAKFVGLQLGARHRLLPLALKRRMSALPTYWSS